MNEIFRRNGRPSQMLVPAIAAACGVRILEFTFNAGASMHSNWVARDWELTDQDLKSLTISFLVRATRACSTALLPLPVAMD